MVRDDVAKAVAGGEVHVTIVEAVRAVLGKYATFSGRARRSEYWYWTLAVLIADVVARVVDGVLGVSLLTVVLGLAVIVPGIAVSVRRMHDTGRSGWFLLLGLIPLVGAVILIVWFCGDSKPGDNVYGPSPKGGQTYGYGPPTTL